MKVVSLFAVSLLFAVACESTRPPAPTNSALAAYSPNKGEPAVASESDAAIPIFARDATWGSRVAPVTIVEFADFECPFCSRAEAVLGRLREKYGPDRIRIVWKNDPLPFHPDARPAAEAAAGVGALAGSGAFWRFHDSALAAQNGLTEEAFVAWARAAGVSDIPGFRAGLRSHAWNANIDADVAEAANLGITGTPWFFINGVPLVGAQPDSEFETIISAAFGAAARKVASGVPADGVYAALAKENFATQKPDDDEAPNEAPAIFKVPLGGSPVRWNPKAPVTIVEFTDYECPYCAAAEPTLHALSVRYADKIRLVVKNEPLPFHRHAEPAAEAALEVRAEKGDAAFWLMHDTLFLHQQDLTDDSLEALAERCGAKGDLVRGAMSQHKYKAIIDADGDLAEDLGADGTPHFFIDGRPLSGAQPEEKFAGLIDEEIKKAQALQSAGTAPEALYDALTKEGTGPKEPERHDLAAIPSSDPSRGSSTAPVVVHEFADFQCPFCARAESTLRDLAKAYAGKVQIVWHDLPLPFHEHATLAARAAREARAQRGDSGFWAMHDRLLVPDAALARPDLDADAQALGLNMTKWNAAFDSGAYAGAIDADRTAAESMGFGGTPSFLIAGRGAKAGFVVTGAERYSKFRRLVERVLAETP